MARTRARERHLRQLAERRMDERRRRRRQRIAAGVVGGLVAVAGIGFGVWAFLNREENPGVNETGATPEATSEPKSLGGVACEAGVPADAGKKKPTFKKPPEMQIDLNLSYRVAMTTSCGEISLQLFDDKAPKTVNNLLFLVRKGFYDGLTFHRIVPNFVVQGGDPKGDGTGGPGYQFEDEIVESLKFDRTGLLAMANSGPNTNGSQFFITTGDASHLNGKHTIFGKVIGSPDALNRLSLLEASGDGRPLKTAYIESVTIIQK